MRQPLVRMTYTGLYSRLKASRTVFNTLECLREDGASFTAPSLPETFVGEDSFAPMIMNCEGEGTSCIDVTHISVGVPGTGSFDDLVANKLCGFFTLRCDGEHVSGEQFTSRHRRLIKRRVYSRA